MIVSAFGMKNKIQSAVANIVPAPVLAKQRRRWLSLVQLKTGALRSRLLVVGRKSVLEMTIFAEQPSQIKPRSRYRPSLQLVSTSLRRAARALFISYYHRRPRNSSAGIHGLCAPSNPANFPPPVLAPWPANETRDRDTGESPNSLRYLCINSSCLFEIVSHGFCCTYPEGSFSSIGVSCSFLSASTHRP